MMSAQKNIAMDRLHASAIRSVLQSLLEEVSRTSGLPRKQLTLSDLKVLSPQQFDQMELRMVHIVKHHASPDGLFSQLSNDDSIPQLAELKDGVQSMLKNGRLQVRDGEPLLSANEAHAKMKTVVPFIFSAISGQLSTLSCFASADSNYMWLATAGKSADVIRCVGYAGEIRQLSLDKLRQSGFSALQGGAEAAKQVWMQTVRAGVLPSEIKQASLFVGRHMFPGFHQNVAEEKLSELMNKYPERLRQKPKAPVSHPKI